MLKIKLRPIGRQLKQLQSKLEGAGQRHLMGRVNAMAPKLRALVQARLRELLNNHKTIQAMLEGDLRGPMGVEANKIEAVLEAIINGVRVNVVGGRNPRLSISYIDRGKLLGMAEANIITENGKHWAWLEFLIGENILAGSIADHVYRTQLGGNSLADWSRTNEGVMIHRDGKEWRFPAEYSRDFLTEVLTEVSEYTGQLLNRL